MKLLMGDAFHFLHELKPRFIVTDSNPETIPHLIKFCEKHYIILINAYSTRWLTAVDEHPAQKRVEPYEALIRAFPDEPVVCDPFMGSGTIGEAALRCGRDFIGIELHQHWFDIASARLNAIQNATAR